MLIRLPDYYQEFRCLAGACPHTCCAKWEVVIDPDTAASYRGLSGPLGDRLRASLVRDEEGDWCFPLAGDRCPFLDRENLCEIHRALGEEATSVTCREHPRFTEDYGPFREITLSASCPAANALLLGSTAPLTFRTLETEEPGEEGDGWLSFLVPLRDRMLDLLQDRTLPLEQRLERFLGLAEAAQEVLDDGALEMMADLEPRKAPLPPVDLGLLAELEVLEPDWPALLAAAEAAAPVPQLRELLERTAVYFAFRYLLKTVNDGELLSRARLCVYAVLAVERIAWICGLPEALRRFSCEVEHDEDNLERLCAMC